MDKLNEYLQELISTSSYELHLEPNANPYVISADGSTDVAESPLLGSQISMMVFPLIPADVKQELPNKPAIQFVHPSNLGEFTFTVQKSPAGFNVTITPVTSNPPVPANAEAPTINLAPDDTPPIDLQPIETFAKIDPADEAPKHDLYQDFESGLPEFEVEVEGLETNGTSLDDLLPGAAVRT